jgi:hypothetical protein
MINRYLLPFFTLLALAAGLNLIGEGQGLYDRLAWYDVMMHAIGGAWSAVLVLWLSTTLGIRPRYAILWALAVGVGWEFLELSLGFTHLSDIGYAADTAKDLCMDTIGALVALGLNRLVNRRRS